LAEVLSEWLAHRREVLQRRSRHRLAAIERRLELLSGFLIAYLNLDEVIRIIREEDEPKLELMKTFELTDVQAEAILNMRLRSLRKLEELEIRKEFDGLTNGEGGNRGLLASDAKQWQTVAWEVGNVRKTFSKETELGARRTRFAEAPVADLAAIEQAMIEKEPITVVISEKGWIRGMKGHLADYAGLQFKDGDKLKLAFHANTTDKLVIVTTGGKAYTLGADKLPGGRGHGEPLRIMVDMDNDQAVLTAFVHDPARKLLMASTAGNGFIVAESDMVANTRKGKQIMNVSLPDETRLCVPGDRRSRRRDRRKPQDADLPALATAGDEPRQGRTAAALQGWRRADIRCFAMEEGLTWEDSAGRAHNRKKEELTEWIADRAQAGRLVPKGFPRSGKFS
jgi:topoisomerase-4 subunit A